MKKINAIASLSVLAMFVLLSACNKDNISADAGLVDVVFSSSFNKSLNKSFNEESVVLSNLSISVREIKLKVDDDYYEEMHQESGEDNESDSSDVSEDNEDHGLTDSTYHNTKLNGPFSIDLLKEGVPAQFSLNNLEVPNATYDKVEFKLAVNESLAETENLFGRSLYMSGTINGTPFVMWSKKDQEFKIKLPDGEDLDVATNSLELQINFNLAMLTSSIQQIDLSKATDGDGDGVIEIGNDDQDGNNDLADKIMESIKKSGHLGRNEEHDDDHKEKDEEHSDDK